MARTQLPVLVMGKNGGGLDSVTFTNGDAANDHYFLNSGRELVIMRNTNGTPKTATVVSVADRHGRSGDKTITCPATTGVSIYGPFAPSLFGQRGTDRGRVHIDLTDATGVTFAVVQADVAPASGL